MTGLPGSDVLDSLPTQMGLVNALRTGNMIVDMAVCMLLPVFFGGIAAVLKEASPSARRLANVVRTRNEVRRTISYERRMNQYGWTVGTVTQDHYLQKALMLYISKHGLTKKRQKNAMLQLTELPKKEQDKSDDKDDGYDSGYDSDDYYGAGTTLKKMEVTVMPPEDEWSARRRRAAERRSSRSSAAPRRARRARARTSHTSHTSARVCRRVRRDTTCAQSRWPSRASRVACA
jgi:hypothetical protein